MKHFIIRTVQQMNAQLKKNQCEFMTLIRNIFQALLIKVAQEQ